MRFDITDAVRRDHPGIEDLLWRVAVLAKTEDPDIKLMGLHVRAIRSTEEDHWNGWAWPEEDSILYGKKLVHPAGRIDLRIGAKVDDAGIMQLFAHELRHIGQFHRGRQSFGYLTTDHMTTSCEQDCYDFEDLILSLTRHTKCKGRNAHQV